jgi:hypothetical protein
MLTQTGVELVMRRGQIGEPGVKEEKDAVAQRKGWRWPQVLTRKLFAGQSRHGDCPGPLTGRPAGHVPGRLGVLFFLVVVYDLSPFTTGKNRVLRVFICSMTSWIRSIDPLQGSMFCGVFHRFAGCFRNLPCSFGAVGGLRPGDRRKRRNTIIITIMLFEMFLSRNNNINWPSSNTYILRHGC